MVKKRERLEVIYDILTVISRENNKARATKILKSSNLSPQMYNEYRDELIGKKLIKKDKCGKMICFSLTAKGISYLQEYKNILNFIEYFGL